MSSSRGGAVARLLPHLDDVAGPQLLPLLDGKVPVHHHVPVMNQPADLRPGLAGQKFPQRSDQGQSGLLVADVIVAKRRLLLVLRRHAINVII